MLWIALHLPDLPLQLYTRAGQAEAMAVVEERRILAVSKTAGALGVQPGMSLATARALAPGLVLKSRSPRAEEAALAELAAWAGQFTPHACIDPPDTLLLEVAGSLRLFGGLDALQAQAAEGCAALGFDARAACAPTPLAARLLARAGVPDGVRDGTPLAQALAPLPVALIDWAPEAQETLAGIGAVTLGDVLALPRAGLARRCGAALLHGLDRALGIRPDPRAWFVPPQTWSARLEPIVPVEHTEAILFAARRLIAGLCGHLGARQAGIERFVLELEHEDLPATRLCIAFAGWNRDEARLLAVLREHLGRTALAAPVAGIRLVADEIRPLAVHTQALFDDDHGGREQCAALIERLRARLGFDAVSGVRALPAHRPEFAWSRAEPGERRRAEALTATRPLWLLNPPQMLETRDGEPRLNGPLALVAGPERIESGWWDGDDAARDYFVAVGPQEETLWIFRERRPPHGWYLHGLFA